MPITEFTNVTDMSLNVATTTHQLREAKLLSLFWTLSQTFPSLTWTSEKLVPDSSKMRIGISFLQNHQLNGAWWLLSLFLQPCLEILIECSDPSVKTTSRVNMDIGNQDAVWKAINRSIVVTHYLYVQARNGKEKFTSKDVEMLHWKLNIE